MGYRCKTSIHLNRFDVATAAVFAIFISRRGRKRKRTAMNKMVVVTVCEEKHQRLLRAFVRLFSFFLLSCVCACGRFVSYFFGSADLFLLFSFFFLLIFTIKYFYVRTKMTGKNYLNDETDVKTSTDLDRYGCEKHLCTRPIITKWFF